MQNKGIIGAVCGDIIGSAYEFHKTKDMNFKLFTHECLDRLDPPLIDVIDRFNDVCNQ